MAVYKEPRFTRRFFTKWRGGLSVTEIAIAVAVALIVALVMGESVVTVIGGLGLGVFVAWQSRKFPTMHRDVRIWMAQAVLYVIGRAYPGAQRRLMNNKLRVPEQRKVHGGVVIVLGEEGSYRGSKGQAGRAKKRSLRRLKQRPPAIERPQSGRSRKRRSRQ